MTGDEQKISKLGWKFLTWLYSVGRTWCSPGKTQSSAFSAPQSLNSCTAGKPININCKDLRKYFPMLVPLLDIVVRGKEVLVSLKPRVSSVDYFTLLLWLLLSFTIVYNCMCWTASIDVFDSHILLVKEFHNIAYNGRLSSILKAVNKTTTVSRNGRNSSNYLGDSTFQQSFLLCFAYDLIVQLMLVKICHYLGRHAGGRNLAGVQLSKSHWELVSFHFICIPDCDSLESTEKLLS